MSENWAGTWTRDGAKVSWFGGEQGRAFIAEADGRGRHEMEKVEAFSGFLIFCTRIFPRIHAV
jgi:hypothetical protein